MHNNFAINIQIRLQGSISTFYQQPIPLIRAVFIHPKRENNVTNETTVKQNNITHYEEKDGEEYMNERQLAHLESILVSWRQSLMEEVDRTVTHMKDKATNYADPSDRATQEEEMSLELRTRDRERKLIKKIEDALERLRDDDFGYCEACGIEIGLRRLEARPTATLCIDCKTLAEIREKQNQAD
ncbi:MAG: RNA polymerase-binding protein DksA [Legionellaceae bacterium]|nr:RNA polymerase-binding protein DksA [Legionellaceae bacterium]